LGSASFRSVAVAGKSRLQALVDEFVKLFRNRGTQIDGVRHDVKVVFRDASRL
jgi:hypothetical protein